MNVWDVDMGMCMPLPMAGMPMTMLMLRGNAFAASISEAGPRGRTAVASPHMVMLDIGTSLGERHYVNLDIMGTAEKWTFPTTGYPELLQIGEHDEQGTPFLDAQHPHSSPLMGITLSDTLRLDTGGEKDHLKLLFAPRGQALEGPVAFMHRPTGIANPDAPLGHHIGQDAGHITSTVFGASLKLGDTRIETSAFNGTEPEPTHVDLPLGAPNSYSLRLIEEFSPSLMAMVSAAYVKEPEHDDPSTPFIARYSASLYTNHLIFNHWRIYNSVILGLITKFDHATSLGSFGEEFWLHNEGGVRAFGRIELLERTPGELQIATADPYRGRWIAAVTLGGAHTLTQFTGGELALGGSISKDFLPGEFQAEYGGSPWSGKIFLQLNGMEMWHL